MRVAPAPTPVGRERDRHPTRTGTRRNRPRRELRHRVEPRYGAQMADALPIDDALPELLAALAAAGRAVLQAPPGAGKTTRIPLALLDAVPGRILMLEPRRLAARAAAERMAATLGEPVGATVGYRMRGDSVAGGRIEVVTEGILTRMIQRDPSLEGIGAVIFDEFHERSLPGDLGLALAWDVRQALRPDLWILVMSATLDTPAAAAMLDGAPVVTSAGRAFPVDVAWRDAPLARGPLGWAEVADAIVTAVPGGGGTLLCFLPGEGEIRRVARALEGRLPPGVTVHPLFGAMPFAAQRAVTAGGPDRVVLATSIAETSLTIPGVTSVVDAGWARRARHDPGSGMSRLLTERVSRAEADQRAGRAGRVAPGTCHRLWTRGEEGALAAWPPAAIETGDLAGLVLDCAVWGARRPGDLRFPTAPSPAAWDEAQALLRGLGALDRHGAVTAHGRAMATTPLHPRLAHMLRTVGPEAADLAALLSERDMMRGATVDLTLRLDVLSGGAPHAHGAAPGTVARVRAEARRLRGRRGGGTPARDAAERAGRDKQPANGPGAVAEPSSWKDRGRAGRMAALAYPDRIGLRRPGTEPRWLLSGGKEAAMDPGDPMAGARLIVVTDTDGHPTRARIRQAVEISEADLRAVHAGAIGWAETVAWSRRDGRVAARRHERFGALVLDDRAWTDAPPEAVVAAMLDGVRQMGLVWTAPARRFRARVVLARGDGADVPDLSDAALMAGLEDWLAPWLDGVRNAADWRGFDVLPALRAMLDHAGQQSVDRIAPAHVVTPLGRRLPVDYDTQPPSIEVRLQEMFGVTAHPCAGGLPLRVTLLSPAGRPVQVTTDLPGFWADTYAEVRRDLRGRYPRHPWPEDPAAAPPATRAKRRGT